MPQTTTDRQRRSIGGSIVYRSAAEDAPQSRRIEGYALLFDTESAPFPGCDPNRVIVETIDPAAVTRALLDGCDIKMNYDHDNRHLLARSVNGEGSLTYDVDDHGVSFAFDAPETADGDMVLQLVRRRDLRGCSFCFTPDYDSPHGIDVTREALPDGREKVTIRHRSIVAIHDFAITPDPAYPATTVEARALTDIIASRLIPAEPAEPETPEVPAAPSAELRTLRRLAKPIF